MRVALFPSLGVAATQLSSLVYLDFLNGLTLADFAYLLTAASPPTFATRLTHLALRVHWRDREAAAVLLPSLPSMYPSLTHVHIGVQSQASKAELGQCGEWDAAVRGVRVAVGTAWCDSAEDVVACREDVVWRCSVGLPAQVWSQPYQAEQW